jgi:hypothetical protein
VLRNVPFVWLCGRPAIRQWQAHPVAQHSTAELSTASHGMAWHGMACAASQHRTQAAPHVCPFTTVWAAGTTPQPAFALFTVVQDPPTGFFAAPYGICCALLHSSRQWLPPMHPPCRLPSSWRRAAADTSCHPCTHLAGCLPSCPHSA